MLIIISFMKKKVKKYLIPQKDNDFHPHLLGTFPLAVLTLVVFAILAFSSFHIQIINSPNLASVVSRVLVDMTNTERARENIGLLSTNPLLTIAAQAKANDMAQKGYFAHNSPEGLTPWYWMKEAGYSFAYAGENLAVNFTDSADVEDGWMNSIKHRENILNKKFTEIGIATAQGIYKGKETTFVVQMFGRPNSHIVNSEIIVTSDSLNTDNKKDSVIKDRDLEVLGDTFIAVAEPDVLYVEDFIDEMQNDKEVNNVTKSERKVNLFDVILTSPSLFMKILYVILAGLIFVALIGSFFVKEARRKKFLHKIFAILLIVLIFLLFYIIDIFVFDTTIII